MTTDHTTMNLEEQARWRAAFPNEDIFFRYNLARGMKPSRTFGDGMVCYPGDLHVFGDRVLRAIGEVLKSAVKAMKSCHFGRAPAGMSVSVVSVWKKLERLYVGWVRGFGSRE